MKKMLWDIFLMVKQPSSWNHTHIPTNDARVLKNGTAYQTDAGMCGDYDSVIGMNKDNSLVDL